jgi:hypothetical protein
MVALASVVALGLTVALAPAGAAGVMVALAPAVSLGLMVPVGVYSGDRDPPLPNPWPAKLIVNRSPVLRGER